MSSESIILDTAVLYHITSQHRSLDHPFNRGDVLQYACLPKAFEALSGLCALQSKYWRQEKEKKLSNRLLGKRHFF